ncbi:MAG: ABC transporter ATP-binding protein [Bacillota bacterium]
METILRLEHITKKFGDFAANDDICLEVKKGEIHSLLGENGAGKSTLMNVLYGLYKPNAGRIILEGRQIVPESPRQMLGLGVAMVHQHFMLVPTLTVAENVILGTMRPFKVRIAEVAKRISALSDKLGFEIDPYAKVSTLTVGSQQRVEIIKALYRNVKVLILDEPTAILTPAETDELILLLKQLAADGMSILFISHKFNEVFSLSDTVSVMRRGKVVGTLNKGEFSKEKFAQLMTGRDVEFTVDRGETAFGGQNALIRIEKLSVPGENDKRSVKNVSFSVNPGEILAITGVDGNGQNELLEALIGARRPIEGEIYMLEEQTTRMSSHRILERYAGYIPGDRQHEGLLLDMSIEENLILECHRKPPYVKRHSLQAKEIEQFGRTTIKTYDIRAQDTKQTAGSLSGGNQQKVVVARALTKSPKILLAAYPTRGLDVGAIEFIHKLILEQRQKGCAVVLFSNELDEVFALGDRIGVMFEGRMIGIHPCGELNGQKVGLMMAGQPLE